MQPTFEQTQALEAFTTGEDMVIDAGAGSGKTTVLKLMAETTQRKGVYLAYNRAIAQEAKAKFPSTVQCATAHSFAFRAVGFQYKHRLNGPRMTGRQTAQALGIFQPFKVNSEVSFGPDQQARIVMQTVKRFCYSADSEINRYHVPFQNGVEDMGKLAAHILPYAIRAWADIQDRNGRLRFEHDHYLKIWAMSNPSLNADYVLLDEAQDANPVIAQVVLAQDSQKIMVGDRCQAIYGWRGAVDAMTTFEAPHRLVLSQSFRFGNAVAEEANKWLNLLDAPLRLKGFEKIDSKVETIEEPDAILCRTNAEAIAQALHAQNAGRKAALVGGTAEIKKLAEAAIDLQMGRGTWHPDLAAFKTWEQVQQYVQEEDGSDLKVFVRLIDSYGAEAVIQVADNSVSEERADVVISTAHKAKGREWDRVKIASDFRAPSQDNDEELNRPEMMLLYVSVTRARLALDNESIQWVDRWVKAA